MILYYSGTGNSAYVANQIGAKLEDEVIDLFERIRAKDYSEIHSDRAMIFVYPTYGWQMPRILEDWIRKTTFTGEKKVYFVTTCGSGKGNPEENLKGLCEAKGFHYRGCAGIVMPENYIAMFPVPEEKEAKHIIFKAKEPIQHVIRSIKKGESLKEEKANVVDKMCSTIVNKTFYKLFVKANKFYAKDNCIGCGKCESICPLSNVKIEAGKPVWGNECTHCMACICKCPVEAIEYGKISKGKPRYQCPVK